MEIACTAGSQISYSAAGCTLKFGPQKPVGGAAYTNLAGKLTIKLGMTNIKYLDEGFSCFILGGNTTDFTFTDDVLLEGLTDVAASQNATTHAWTFTEGAALSIAVD
jgi:hypothetical protein